MWVPQFFNYFFIQLSRKRHLGRDLVKPTMYVGATSSKTGTILPRDLVCMVLVSWGMRCIWFCGRRTKIRLGDKLTDLKWTYSIEKCRYRKAFGLIFLSFVIKLQCVPLLFPMLGLITVQLLFRLWTSKAHIPKVSKAGLFFFLLLGLQLNLLYLVELAESSKFDQ